MLREIYRQQVGASIFVGIVVFFYFLLHQNGNFFAIYPDNNFQLIDWWSPLIHFGFFTLSLLFLIAKIFIAHNRSRFGGLHPFVKACQTHGADIYLISRHSAGDAESTYSISFHTMISYV